MTTFPKFRDGMTLKESRHARRLDRTTEQDALKLEARRRDGYQCRWPRCEYSRVTAVIEAAHIRAAGIGGDPRAIRTQRDGLIAICDMHHRRAEQNLHNGGLRIEALTPDGADGPCSFSRWDPKERRYFIVAQEREPRILERD